MRVDRIAVIGAGGHARVVIATLKAAGLEPMGAYDDDKNKWGAVVSGIVVRGPLDLLKADDSPKAIAAIGDNVVRRRIVALFPSLQWISVVHPRAIVELDATIGPGSVVFAGAVVQTGTAIGSHAIVNTSASVDHDCIIGDYAHIAPGAHLAGGVRVGDGVLIGIGAAVLPGVRIDANAIIGAGSVVIRDVPEGVTLAGVPARQIRK